MEADVVHLKCVADAEGLSLLGVIAPFSSALYRPVGDGPADTKRDPFCDLLSVDVSLDCRFYHDSDIFP